MRKNEKVIVLKTFGGFQTIYIYKAIVKSNGAKTITVTYSDGDGERFYHSMINSSNSTIRVVPENKKDEEIQRMIKDFNISSPKVSEE